MFKKIIICIFLSYIYLSNCLAAPSISIVTGSFCDGENIIVSGSGFSSNSLSIEWLGGDNGNIEQGSGDFTKTGWTVDTTSSDRQTPAYSTTKYHSGSQSILCEMPVQTQYTSGFTYDHGTTFDSVYVTYWVYFDHVDSLGQWKMWRIRPSSGYGNMDGEIMSSQWYTALGANYQNYVMIFCDYLSYDQCYPGGIDDHYGDSDDIITPGEWIRVEIYAVGSSVDDEADGELYYTITREDETTHVMRDYSGVTTRLTGSNKWRYFVFENYWGNIETGTGTNENIYIDDIFIQSDNRARVEIGNNSTFSSCTHREIQIPTAWSDTSITATVNQGSFENGTAYLFVVDSNGDVSSGYEITFVDEEKTYSGVKFN